MPMGCLNKGKSILVPAENFKYFYDEEFYFWFFETIISLVKYTQT